MCVSRSKKRRGSSRLSRSSADTSSKILVQQALTRRALAMDQANLVEFSVADQWTQSLMKARMQTPAEHFDKTIVEATGVGCSPSSVIRPVQGCKPRHQVARGTACCLTQCAWTKSLVCCSLSLCRLHAMCRRSRMPRSGRGHLLTAKGEEGERARANSNS